MFLHTDIMTYVQKSAAKCRNCVCTGNIAQPHFSKTLSNHVWLYIKKLVTNIRKHLCELICKM